MPEADRNATQQKMAEQIRLDTNLTYNKTGMSVTPNTVEPRPSFKAQGIIIARGSIDSAFDNQSRDDFDSSVKVGHIDKSQASMTNGQHSMTIMKAPYADGSFTTSIQTGIGQPSVKTGTDIYDNEVSRIALLGNNDISISHQQLREIETPAQSI